MSVVRWVLDDPITSASFTFPLNPKEMGGLDGARKKQVGSGTPVEGRMRIWAEPQQVWEWQFSGELFEQTSYDAFNTWVAKDYPVELTDHMGRVWSLLMVDFAPEPKIPTRRHPVRWTYVMRTLVLGRVA